MSLSKFQVRILLNHFKWDKERLMERLYSDDQEAMFVEAQVSWEEAKNLFLPRPKKKCSGRCMDGGQKIFVELLLLGHFPFQEEARTGEEEDNEANRGV